MKHNTYVTEDNNSPVQETIEPVNEIMNQKSLEISQQQNNNSNVKFFGGIIIALVTGIFIGKFMNKLRGNNLG